MNNREKENTDKKTMREYKQFKEVYMKDYIEKYQLLKRKYDSKDQVGAKIDDPEEMISLFSIFTNDLNTRYKNNSLIQDVGSKITGKIFLHSFTSPELIKLYVFEKYNLSESKEDLNKSLFTLAFEIKEKLANITNEFADEKTIKSFLDNLSFSSEIGDVDKKIIIKRLIDQELKQERKTKEGKIRGYFKNKNVDTMAELQESINKEHNLKYLKSLLLVKEEQKNKFLKERDTDNTKEYDRLKTNITIHLESIKEKQEMVKEEEIEREKQKLSMSMTPTLSFGM